MTIEECYKNVGADYADVIRRLGSEETARYFALKFLNDGTFSQLESALNAGDGETAFRAAHTLKGIALNLGFDSLYKADFDLTEKLRGRSTDGCEEFFCRHEKGVRKPVRRSEKGERIRITKDG